MYVEAQVQNITTSLMSMESVTLEPSTYYDVVDLNERKPELNDTSEDEDEEVELTFGGSYLNPLDTRQYLYKIIAKKEHSAEIKNRVSRRMRIIF